MGAQTKGNMADPRQRQMTNERMPMRGEGASSNQQPSREQEVGIGNYEREQQQYLRRQAMAKERQAMDEQRQAMAEQMQRQQSGVERSNANREQEQYLRRQAMAEQRQRQQSRGERRANNTPTPGSGIDFGPGRSSRGALTSFDLRRLLEDRGVEIN